MVRTIAGAYCFPSLLYKKPITVATIVFRLILAKFRPNSDKKILKFRPNSDQIQTDFDHFQLKFRPTVNRQQDVFTTTLILQK